MGETLSIGLVHEKVIFPALSVSLSFGAERIGIPGAILSIAKVLIEGLVDENQFVALTLQL